MCAVANPPKPTPQRRPRTLRHPAAEATPPRSQASQTCRRHQGPARAATPALQPPPRNSPRHALRQPDRGSPHSPQAQPTPRRPNSSAPDPQKDRFTHQRRSTERDPDFRDCKLPPTGTTRSIRAPTEPRARLSSRLTVALQIVGKPLYVSASMNFPSDVRAVTKTSIVLPSGRRRLKASSNSRKAARSGASSISASCPVAFHRLSPAESLTEASNEARQVELFAHHSSWAEVATESMRRSWHRRTLVLWISRPPARPSP